MARPVHYRIIRGRDAYTACEPQIRRTGYVPVVWTDTPAAVTCTPCLATLATTPCDHGPVNACPRDVARQTLAVARK